jgi:hypothetical protein
MADASAGAELEDVVMECPPSRETSLSEDDYSSDEVPGCLNCGECLALANDDVDKLKLKMKYYDYKNWNYRWSTTATKLCYGSKAGCPECVVFYDSLMTFYHGQLPKGNCEVEIRVNRRQELLRVELSLAPEHGDRVCFLVKRSRTDSKNYTCHLAWPHAADGVSTIWLTIYRSELTS